MHNDLIDWLLTLIYFFGMRLILFRPRRLLVPLVIKASIFGVGE